MVPRSLGLEADRMRGMAPSAAPARALLIADGRIAWMGDRLDDAPEAPDQTVRLPGAWLQPAFVNAHCHLTAIGLGLTGLDLSEVESHDDCLAAVRAAADLGEVIWARGWDDSRWPDGGPPQADELTAAGGDRPTLLVRADGHSVVVDRTSLSTLPISRLTGIDRSFDGRPTGLLRGEAATVAYRWMIAALPPERLAEARTAAAAHAAAHGVLSVHEMGSPDAFGRRDFDAWRQGSWPIEVLGYWAEEDVAAAETLAGGRLGGSLALDGTIGSHTAALLAPYADRDTPGHLYRSSEDLASLLSEAVARGVQPALHAVGDAAVTQAVEVLERVAESSGIELLHRARPRLEHATLTPPALLPRLAELGVTVVLQPVNDRLWGGRNGLYRTRLGVPRARRTNPMAELLAAGVTIAFGQDTGPDPLDPWDGIDAAVTASGDRQRIAFDAALRAATLGGRLAARQQGVGLLEAGARADVAAFVGDGAQRRCVLSVRAGVVVHDRTAGLAAGAPDRSQGRSA